jgi:hypothetical protein
VEREVWIVRDPRVNLGGDVGTKFVKESAFDVSHTKGGVGVDGEFGDVSRWGAFARHRRRDWGSAG